ncbi:hypothetical protein HBI56_034640 [Parastagonospora nodorum]|nr:hypothetical protein HBH56_022430 [Parastagonospora nodorum]QRC95586.1 hypothetical protein JI435_032600 [Parastagonospora nodorum SN15]KAH3937261.1 hypothetical protein HBH54_012050 [Parastagonospora nodorum]KAH3944087.1 hypothetical protein HBH53_164670 [Parastagonospora nodorum]KAH3990002.1 hypothetical protein HBH52_001000 [Parastagonospora nodorum]
MTPFHRKSSQGWNCLRNATSQAPYLSLSLLSFLPIAKSQSQSTSYAHPCLFVNDLNTIDKLIECRNVDTEEEVNWSAFFGYYDFDPHPSFLADDDFVEISIDKPWRFEYTLENMVCEYDTVRSMFGLESSQKYSTRIADSALSAFSRWQYGRKEDLLSGLEEDKKQRWKIDRGKRGILVVEQMGEPAEFEVLPWSPTRRPNNVLQDPGFTPNTSMHGFHPRK